MEFLNSYKEWTIESGHGLLDAFARSSGCMTFGEFITRPMMRRVKPNLVGLWSSWLGYLRFRGAI